MGPPFPMPPYLPQSPEVKRHRATTTQRQHCYPPRFMDCPRTQNCHSRAQDKKDILISGRRLQASALSKKMSSR